MLLTIPPIKSHMDLSVGAPVKKRETPDVNELTELTPKTSRTTPSTSNAIPMGLFIGLEFPFAVC